MEIAQSIVINASKQKVLDFFDLLAKDPSLYKFNSHQGVFPVSGNLREVGSIFETKETFSFIALTLRFETKEVDPNGSFKFKLIKPFAPFNIWGEFRIKPTDEKRTELFLIVYGKPENIFEGALQMKLFFSPARFLVKKQTWSELVFLKKMIENK